LRLAAEQAGWDKGQAQGHGLGITIHESFGSFIAQVADVSVAVDGSFKVEMVVCAIDCGIAINPNVIVAHMEDGIGYALGAAFPPDECRSVAGTDSGAA
jgi:isoquinoline 1-oxidoreductase subunit beta